MRSVIQRLSIIAALAGAAAVAGAQERPATPRFVNPPSLPPGRGYSQVVEVPAGERLLFVAGQIALDSTGALVGSGDFRAQARQVFENLRRALESRGATFADVVKINFYILDVSNIPALREVRDQYVNRAAPPASTLVEVRRLFRDDVMLEVEVIAAVR
jgi:enamine deaminase RidA (YjgF/YER057c/UK114 family)